jgi:hypothetical protein
MTNESTPPSAVLDGPYSPNAGETDAERVVSRRAVIWRLWLTPGGCRLRLTETGKD